MDMANAHKAIMLAWTWLIHIDRGSSFKTQPYMNILLQDIKYLQGVGPQRAELLANELNIHTLGDLLSYYPYKYVDRSRIYRISELSSNMPYIQVCG